MTKIALFEWICGGGLAHVSPACVPHGLRQEGWAMLSTLVDGLQRAGWQITLPLDSRLLSPPQQQRLAQQADIKPFPPNYAARFAEYWLELAADCQLALVVAPELDSALLQVTEELRSRGTQLLNCDRGFLGAASDKWQTAQLLQTHHLPHPPTRLLQHVEADWLLTLQPTAAARWVLKPADGAGCEGLRLLGTQDLLQLCQQEETRQSLAAGDASRQWLVQPWLTGQSLSCSAIVAADGSCRWLPLVTQDFAPLTEQAPLRYIGCSLKAPPSPLGDELVPPLELLQATLQALGHVGSDDSQPAPASRTAPNQDSSALGWVGVDLLYDAQRQTWCVIEVNPRCTTSLVGLCQAYSGNLVADMLHSLLSPATVPEGVFRSTQYRLPASPLVRSDS